MTTEELGGGLGDDSFAPEFPERALDVTDVLDLVDRIMAEPGRRAHVFGWLRRPGGASDDWLPVDAYYPASRLVVVCQELGAPYREVFAELVPAHGLRLLEISADELAAGRDAVMGSLRRRLRELGPPPGRAADSARVDRSWVRAWTGATTQAPGRAGASEVPEESRVPTAGGERQVAGVLAGIALAGVLVAEVYAGVARAGLDSGHVLLAFGLALDVCSRALGTLAAGRARSSEWAWWCALGGSPVVVSFALFQRDGPVRTEPAPLAGLIGVLALLVLLAAVVTGGV
jgi:hypothetical protein